MVTKRFDKKLHAENDQKARNAATKFFEGLDYIVSPNANRYDVDLDLFKGNKKTGIIEGKVGHIECEIKKVWKTKDFPYSDIQVPYRKLKYITNNPLPVYFFMMNEPGNRALIIEGATLAKCPTKEVKNIYCPEGEMFFIVPIESCRFVDLIPEIPVKQPKIMTLSEDSVIKLVEWSKECSKYIDKDSSFTALFKSIKLTKKDEDVEIVDISIDK